nr:MAG TPA: hypothetical protein [Caudoviricetes sp.]DAJ97874.1 MAG TPA: hypothetical protein [Caudoviricetes sp.]
MLMRNSQQKAKNHLLQIKTLTGQEQKRLKYIKLQHLP